MKNIIAILIMLLFFTAGQVSAQKIRYLANGGALDITGKTVKASEIKDLKIVMDLPPQIKSGIAANKYRNIIFEVRIYDGIQQFSTLEGRVDFGRNIGTLKGKPSLTLWLQKEDGTSDYRFNFGVGEREQFNKDPNIRPVAFEAERMRTLKATSDQFKIKVKITPYWMVRTILGPQEKGEPFYYQNETVPVVLVD